MFFIEHGVKPMQFSYKSDNSDYFSEIANCEKNIDCKEAQTATPSMTFYFIRNQCWGLPSCPHSCCPNGMLQVICEMIVVFGDQLETAVCNFAELYRHRFDAHSGI